MELLDKDILNLNEFSFEVREDILFLNDTIDKAFEKFFYLYNLYNRKEIHIDNTLKAELIKSGYIKW